MTDYHQYPKSGAAIPTNAISLSEAFRLFSDVENLFSDAEIDDVENLFSDAEIDDDPPASPPSPASPPASPASEPPSESQPVSPEVAALLAKMSALGKAELVFRDALVKGELVALIRDPQNGQNLQPSDRGRWAWKGSFEPSGIGEGEDYVWPDDSLSPGPDTKIDGQVHPVFFIRANFEQWLSARRRAHNRKMGTSAHARVRAWLKAEMIQNESPKKNKSEYEAQAKADFDIGPRQFKRAWDWALTETGRQDKWTTPGPKKNRAV